MKYGNKLGRESEARSPLQKCQEIRRGRFSLTRALLRSLVGYSPSGHKESDMTEATQHAHMHVLILHHFLILSDTGFWLLLRGCGDSYKSSAVWESPE